MQTSSALPPTDARDQQQRPDPAEWPAALAACERFLHGHGLMRPRQALLALAEEASDDELADSYGRGALIEQFEREVAGLLGKAAAVFL
ncbi:MAG TPA: hypothetical protein VKC57_04045, partial [Ktedonobacterales bacterium]|nr:hypothetical protein [Ktedonobacterales bacterium]